MIEVVRQKSDLLREVWQFQFIDRINCPQLVLAFYQLQEKPTKRRGWKNLNYYYFSDKRKNTVNIEQIPFPEDVQEEALEKFVLSVRVVKSLG